MVLLIRSRRDPSYYCQMVWIFSFHTHQFVLSHSVLTLTADHWPESLSCLKVWRDKTFASSARCFSRNFSWVRTASKDYLGGMKKASNTWNETQSKQGTLWKAEDSQISRGRQCRESERHKCRKKWYWIVPRLLQSDNSFRPWSPSTSHAPTWTSVCWSCEKTSEKVFGEAFQWARGCDFIWV